MNIVGLDISVNSTAMTILNENGYRLYNYTTKQSNYNWFKKLSDIINFRFIELEYKEIEESFSNCLVQRIKDYDKYSDIIINDLYNLTGETILLIEGYNYGLTRTDTIIDLTEFSSLLKYKIIKNFPNFRIKILPPKSIKTKVSDIVYGKKRNNSGTAGGSFDKNDMMEAFIDSKIDINLKAFLMNNQEIRSLKSVPKPFDDVIDSIFMVEIIKNEI